MAAFFRQIGGCKIDGDAPGRQRQARSDQGRTDPLARFGDGLVGQADNGESGSPGAT